MKKFILAAVLCVFTLPAFSATVDFEGLGTGGFPNGYSVGGATFNSLGPNNPSLRTFADLNVGGRTTYLLAADETNSGACCNNPLEVLFANPTDNLSFNIVSDEDADSDATIQFFNSIGTSIVFLTLSGNGQVKDDFFSFSGLNGVTRVVFTPNDPAGLGYDDFTFDSVSAVPVPAALPLFLSGLLGLGAIARRRKSTTA